jgi:hypothetical protein
MSDHPDISKELIQRAAEKYSEATALRAAVQLIPYIGGPLDTLIGGEGQKIQQRRISHFIDELDRRLQNIETPKHALANEDLYDLMVSTFEQVARARSEEKRTRFAQVVANEIAHAEKFEDVETALRLIGELDDLHIHILNIATHAPPCPAPYDGLRVITIAIHLQIPSPNNDTYPVLGEIFPDIPEPMLRLICSELVSKGLLRDEGVGRYDAKAMEYFIATDLTAWLLTWIND